MDERERLSIHATDRSERTPSWLGRGERLEGGGSTLSTVREAG
jgi:hypothetical protein